MGLLAPVALILLPLLLVVVALYLLRLRRPETAVSSLYLWATLLRDQEANAPWQRLRANLLLLLQLIVLLALILAVARPWAVGAQLGAHNLVLIVDTSASMASTDVAGGGSRLDAAKALAWQRVLQAPTTARVTLLAMGAGADVVLAGSSDRVAIQAAITGLQARPSTTDLRDALNLAAALAARAADSETDIYSDGRFPLLRGDVGSVAGQLFFTPVGTRNENQAILALALRRNAGAIALFAQVANNTEHEVTRRLDVDLDGTPWAGRVLTLAPGETQPVLLDDVPLTAQVVHAKLAGSDDLALDDEAWTVNRLADPSPVLLVTAGNRFLQNALVLLPNVTLEKTLPGDFVPSPTATLTVFDHVVPTGTLPTGSLLFVAPPQSSSLFDVTGVLTTPTVTQPDPTGAPDPLLRFLDLSDLHIAAAQRLTTPDWAHVVLDSDEGPLILAGETAGRRVVILAFDLHDSDLPIQVAYPLLMRNIVGYLLPEPAGGLPADVDVGATVPVQADEDAILTRITVEPPPGSGPTRTFAIDPTHRQFMYAETQALGLYIVTEWDGARAVRREGFAVNLFSPEESYTSPRANPSLPLGSAAPEAVAADPDRVEWWPILAVLGLVVLVAEWLLTQRMALRRLAARLRAGRRPAEAR